jgi:hypothetical protein
VLAVLSLYGTTHAARSPGSMGEYFAFHYFSTSGPPVPARNFRQSRKTWTGTRTKWAVIMGEVRTAETHVVERIARRGGCGGKI